MMTINHNHNYCKLHIEINEFYYVKFKMTFNNDNIPNRISNVLNGLNEMSKKSVLPLLNIFGY